MKGGPHLSFTHGPGIRKPVPRCGDRARPSLTNWDPLEQDLPPTPPSPSVRRRNRTSRSSRGKAQRARIGGLSSPLPMTAAIRMEQVAVTIGSGVRELLQADLETEKRAITLLQESRHQWRRTIRRAESSSRRGSRTKRATPTGWKPSSRSWTQSERRTTSRSSFGIDRRNGKADPCRSRRCHRPRLFGVSAPTTTTAKNGSRAHGMSLVLPSSQRGAGSRVGRSGRRRRPPDVRTAM